MREAIAVLENSRPWKEAFGKEVVEYYLNAEELEQMEYDRRVKDF